MAKKDPLEYYLYQSLEMNEYALKHLKKCLRKKDNFIKKDIDLEIQSLKQMRQSLKAHPKQSFLSHYMVKKGIEKEVKKDNSDVSIAYMLIQGTRLGNQRFNQKYKALKSKSNPNICLIAQDYSNFLLKEIATFKRYI